MKRILYAIAAILFVITLLSPTIPLAKSQFVEAILEERSRVNHLPILLVVDSPTISGLTLPKDIDGIPVKLVIEAEFNGMPTLPYTISAVRFDEITLWFYWWGDVKF